MNLNFKHLSIEEYDIYKKHINSDFTLQFYDNFLKNVLNEKHIIIILKNSDLTQIIASGTLLIEDKLTYGGCKMGHIENILVEENFRGKGYGKKIVDYLVNYARDNKCYRIDLSCEEKLVDFYQLNGFNNKIICMSQLFKENFHKI